MNAKKLSMLAVLALSCNVARAEIVDLGFGKSDLAAIERATAIASTCKSVYELFLGDMNPGKVASGLGYAGYVADFTGAAMESGHDVSTVKRIADECKEAKKLINKSPLSEWEVADYGRMSATFIAAVINELAHGFSVKTVKKHFGDNDNVKNRVTRRVLYILKDTILDGCYSALKAGVFNGFVKNEADSKKLWDEAQTAMWKGFVASLAKQIIGEVLISTAKDSDAAPEVLKANKALDELTGPLI